MKKITLYHNAQCSKSRAVFDILKQAKVDFSVFEYLENPPSVQLIEALLTELSIEPEKLVRSGEEVYEEIKAQGRLPTNRKAWIELLAANPILIERPIVSNGEKAVVGRPPEKVTQWLKEQS